MPCLVARLPIRRSRCLQSGYAPEAFAEARQQGSFVRYEDPEQVFLTGLRSSDALDFVSQNPALFSSQTEGAFPMEPEDDVQREINQIMHDNSFIAMDPPKHLTIVVSLKMPSRQHGHGTGCDSKQN